MNGTLDKILKYLPLLSGLLIFLGVLKLFIFYQYFDIDIISYLSISDILVAFLSDMNTLVIIAVIACIHIQFSSDAFDILDNIELDRLIYYIRNFLRVLFFLLWTVLSIAMIFQWVNLAIWNIYLAVFLFIQLLSILALKKKKDNDNSDLETELYFPKAVKTIALLATLCVIPLVSMKDIREVKQNQNLVTIELLNGEKITNQSNLYLGKVGEYHFFSKQGVESLIIKGSEVSQILITN